MYIYLQSGSGASRFFCPVAPSLSAHCVVNFGGAVAVELARCAVHFTDFFKVIIALAPLAVVLRLQVPRDFFAMPLEIQCFQMLSVRLRVARDLDETTYDFDGNIIHFHKLAD